MEDLARRCTFPGEFPPIYRLPDYRVLKDKRTEHELLRWEASAYTSFKRDLTGS